MLENSKNCEKCGLCKHQSPLYDEKKTCQVFWVGLSAKMIKSKDEKPLSPTTNSGGLLSLVENNCKEISTYRTNLVKCVPLDESGKLRYPNRNEIKLCLPHLASEIEELTPKIIFLLGGKVIESVSKMYSVSFDKWEEFNYRATYYNNSLFVPVHHPSYVYVYKRKRINEYTSGLERMIQQAL
jgi:DNA polymerase